MTILYGVIVCMYLSVCVWIPLTYAKNTKYAELISVWPTGPKGLWGSFLVDGQAQPKN